MNINKLICEETAVARQQLVPIRDCWTFAQHSYIPLSLSPSVFHDLFSIFHYNACLV